MYAVELAAQAWQKASPLPSRYQKFAIALLQCGLLQTVHPEGGDQASGSGSTADERLQHNQWQGADVEFMQSNNHKRERNGVWDTTGLEGAALHIVSSDQKAARYTLLLLPQRPCTRLGLSSVTARGGRLSQVRVVQL